MGKEGDFLRNCSDSIQLWRLPGIYNSRAKYKKYSPANGFTDIIVLSDNFPSLVNFLAPKLVKTWHMFHIFFPQHTLVHIHHHIINIFAEMRNQTHHQWFILSISLVWCCRCSIFVVELIIFFWKKFILSSTPQLSKSLSAVMVQNHLHHPLPPIYWCSRQPAQEVTQKSILLKKKSSYFPAHPSWVKV